MRVVKKAVYRVPTPKGAVYVRAESPDEALRAARGMNATAQGPAEVAWGEDAVVHGENND